MKKIISTLLALTLILSVFASFSASADGYEVTDKVKILVKTDLSNGIAQIDTSGFNAFSYSIFRLSMNVKISEENYIGTFASEELPNGWTVNTSTGKNPVEISLLSSDNKVPLSDQNLFNFFFDDGTVPEIEVSDIIIRGKDSKGFFVEYSVIPEVQTFISGDGDVNADGVIDIIDVVMTRSHIVGNIVLTDDQQKAADINADESVDIVDVALMRRTIINSEDAETLKAVNAFGKAISASLNGTEISEEDAVIINSAMIDYVNENETIASWKLDPSLKAEDATYFTFYNLSDFDVTLQNYLTGKEESSAGRNQICNSSATVYLLLSIIYAPDNLFSAIEENGGNPDAKYTYSAGIFNGVEGGYYIGIICK